MLARQYTHWPKNAGTSSNEWVSKVRAWWKEVSILCRIDEANDYSTTMPWRMSEGDSTLKQIGSNLYGSRFLCNDCGSQRRQGRYQDAVTKCGDQVARISRTTFSTNTNSIAPDLLPLSKELGQCNGSGQGIELLRSRQESRGSSRQQASA